MHFLAFLAFLVWDDVATGSYLKQTLVQKRVSFLDLEMDRFNI
jgi:hypothetical protein